MALKNGICIFEKNTVNSIANDMEYLHNINISEYFKILVASDRFTIFDIEGHSNI